MLEVIGVRRRSADPQQTIQAGQRFSADNHRTDLLPEPLPVTVGQIPRSQALRFRLTGLKCGGDR
jgi:hypothetical protein